MYKLSTTLLAIGFLVFVNVLNGEVDSENTRETQTSSEETDVSFEEEPELQEYIEEMTEFHEDSLRELGFSDEFIENFEPVSVDDKEAFVESMLEVLREAGASEEILEQSKIWFQGSLDSEDLPPKIPEDVRITQCIEMIEELNAELAGLSNTWKSSEPTEMLSTVMTGIAQIHELPEVEVDKLRTTIEHFYNVIPDQQEKNLRSWTNHYFRLFLITYRFTCEDLLVAERDKQVLTTALTRFSTDKTELDTKGFDSFLKCIDNENKKVNKKVRKRFTSFTRSLEKTLNSVLKSLDSYDENSVDDQRALEKKIMIGLGRSSKVSNAVVGIQYHHCYDKVDVDRINELYGQFTTESESE